MKVTARKELKNGTRRITVELSSNETLLAFDADSHYRLAEPHRDIVRGDHILSAHRVEWCVVEQKWVD